MKNSNETIRNRTRDLRLVAQCATRVLARFIAVQWPGGRYVVTVHPAVSRPM